MSLDDVVHKKFSYIYIPASMDDAVEERSFEGQEKNFRALLNRHFNRENLLKDEEEKFKKDLSHKADGRLTDDQLSSLIAGQHTYQIIPLSLPCKASKYRGTNAYIDSLGRVKDLPTNSRASRICSTDIRGDCFLSTAFDDEDVFERVDFTKEDYEGLMAHPPDPKGRWNETEALAQLMKSQQSHQQQQISSSLSKKEDQKEKKEGKEKRCEFCHKTEEQLRQAATTTTTTSSSSPSENETLSSSPSSSSSIDGQHGQEKSENLGESNTPKKENEKEENEKKKKSSSNSSSKLKRCGRCGEAYYCSEECQRADWKFHKRICTPNKST
ncbi:mynd finger domain-containing protein [Cystoisospora suis]|uniref:Mynd finger domain-containing protein n=1 Tax=Cystoisospora suis TaxID=483139 RepID=A0A2C6KUY2_9APIC|nr:mynd finger domain-containing protein [Cystoisospora suis]